MKKLFYYIIIRLTTRRAMNAVKIFETIYQSKSNETVVIINNGVSEFTEHGKIKSKKQEIMDTIIYLKSKPNKSKKEKESLYTLEMVLKNM